MTNPNNFERAKDKALSLLSFKAYTEKALRDKLKENGCNESIIDQVIERMKEDLLIDDFKLAQEYVEKLFNSKLFSEKRVRFELKNKGIDSNIIEDVLEPYSDRDDLSSAVSLLNKKFKEISDEKTAARAAGLLSRAGYDFDIVKTAIHTLRKFEDTDGEV